MFARLRRLNRRYLATPIWFRLLVSAFTFIVFIVLTQDIQIFPGAFIHLENVNKALPSRVESFQVVTADGKRLEMWRIPPVTPRSGPLRAALFFHGNGGDLRNFFAYQKWLSDIGYVAYAVDFRGFGKSEGWPSEAGIERDADAALAAVLEREKLEMEQLILFGVSIGTAPAAYLAARSEPGALVLLAPFPNIADVVRTMPLYRPLTPFLWYDFPTEQRVGSLKHACFVVAHGKPDEVIPFSLGARVAAAYHGSGYHEFIQSEVAHHNDIMSSEAVKVKAALDACERGSG